MIDEVLDILEKVNDYTYSITIIDSPNLVPFNLYTNSDFFYVLDKGSPLNNITPRRLTEKIEDYFQNTIEKELANEIVDKAFNLNLKESELKSLFEKYSVQLETYIKNLIRNDTHKISFTKDEETLYVDFNAFANLITCKVIKK